MWLIGTDDRNDQSDNCWQRHYREIIWKRTKQFTTVIWKVLIKFLCMRLCPLSIIFLPRIVPIMLFIWASCRLPTVTSERSPRQWLFWKESVTDTLCCPSWRMFGGQIQWTMDWAWMWYCVTSLKSRRDRCLEHEEKLKFVRRKRRAYRCFQPACIGTLWPLYTSATFHTTL